MDIEIVWPIIRESLTLAPKPRASTKVGDEAMAVCIRLNRCKFIADSTLNPADYILIASCSPI
ncbi:MAG: hypothetical protein NDF55_09855 [archaeon GB-1867-005]|nr:hypothetical protein [Candidatus Culexmicrobium cathedralense]